ncbi:MAG: DUF4105 domain-containing protein [Bacteroidales bacterium]|nr:DUF4105 domain-containing protein [Bacteroidales bacterium]
MKRHFILLILLLLGCTCSYAGPTGITDTVKLDSSAYASILTCGPGDEFYETFGHSALRICDTANDVDIVFNYGMFSFDEPHFYLKFAGGQLNYYVSKQKFENFILEYHYYGRWVMEQRLRLTPTELQTLYDALTTNALPENKYYLYDFFRDNCATRIRDKIDEALDGRSILDNSYTTPEASYRNLIYKYTNGTLLWWRLGVDLLLGSRCDKPMTKSQYMYIPMEMMTQLDTMHLADGNTLSEPIVQLLTDKRVPMKKSISPTFCFWILFAVILLLTLLAHRNKWKLYWLDGILFTVVSLVSLLLAYMWFGSNHWCTKANPNLLWANPLFLILLFRLRHRNTAVTIVTACFLLAALLGWVLLPIQLNSAVLPIVLMLLVRLADRIFKQKESQTKTPAHKN